MAKRIPLRLVGPSRAGRSLTLSAERTVNLLLEVNGEGKTAIPALIGTPGLELFVNLSATSPTRGRHVFKGRLFAVVGKDIFEVYEDGTYKRWGSLGTTSGTVGMADSNGKIVIADGAGLFVLDLDTGTLIESLIDGVTPIASNVIGYIDGVIAAVITDTQEVVYSEPLAPQTFLGDSVVAAESNIDYVVGMLVLHQEVQFLGTDTIEPWVYTGGADNAFERRDGGIAERGCGEAHAAFKVNDSFAFVGNDRRIYFMIGYTPKAISSHAVENALGKVDLSTVTGFAFEEEGHIYGQWAIGATSWVYDFTIGAWFERAWLSPTTGQYERHRAEWCANVFGLNLVGDYETGKIYRQSLDVHADNGSPLRRLRRFAIETGLDFPTIDLLRFDLEVGVGLDGDPAAFGADPMLALRMSFDGGATWGSWEECSVGRIGETRAVAEFTRCGSGPDPVCEIACSAPVRLVLKSATATVS